jgi:hypothetical protein
MYVGKGFQRLTWPENVFSGLHTFYAQILIKVSPRPIPLLRFFCWDYVHTHNIVHRTNKYQVLCRYIYVGKYTKCTKCTETFEINLILHWHYINVTLNLSPHIFYVTLDPGQGNPLKICVSFSRKESLTSSSYYSPWGNKGMNTYGRGSERGWGKNLPSAVL